MMTPETRDHSTPIVRESVSRCSPDLEETVAFLECSGRTSAQGYRRLTALLDFSAGKDGVLCLIVRHLDRIEGSLTGFVLGLESIVRSSSRQVLLGDPSGVASLVLSFSDRGGRIRPIRASGSRGRILLVHPSPAAGSILREVLEAFGRTCTLVHSALDARAAIASSAYDAILLDFDLPGRQSYAVAELLKSLPSPPIPIAATRRDEGWTLEHSLRSGFRRILSKPYSVADLLGLVS